MQRCVILGACFAFIALAPLVSAVPNRPNVQETDGTITGTVTLDGTAPQMPLIDLKRHSDAPKCNAPRNQTWIIGDGNGVANVVVFLEPPAGRFFQVDEKLVLTVRSPVIDIPSCVFEPHVVAIFAANRDRDGKLAETGLKLLLKNSSNVAHNTKVKGQVKYNPEISKHLRPASAELFPIAFQKSPLDITCDRHTWMNAKVLTFDHTLFAVTDKDGHFEIKHVPIDVELTVKTWHEMAEPVSSVKAFKKGVNELHLKIKVPS